MAARRSTYLNDELDEVIGEISRERDWSPSKTVANMLKESPLIRDRLRSRGLDPDTLKPISESPDQEARRAS